MVKLDSSGAIVWDNSFGDRDRDEAGYQFGAQQTSDFGYILVGTTDAGHSQKENLYLIKIDAFGNEEWSSDFGGSKTDVGAGVVQASDGGYVIAGYTKSYGAGRRDVYVVKVDVDGDLVWQRTVGGNDDDIAHSISTTNDGGFIVAGYTESFGSGKADAYLMKIDAGGDVEWTDTFGGTGTEIGYNARQADDGGYILVGSVSSRGRGAKDMYVVKTGPAPTP